MSGRDSNEGAGSRLSPDPAEETTRHGPTGLRSLAIDTGPLRRHPQFRLLLAARAITSLGSMSTYVTVPFHVYTLTHSTLAVGLLAVAEIIPLVLSGLLGGALADAFDRRRIIVTTEVGLLAGSGILIANGYLRHPHVWLLFVWAAIASAIGGLQRPAIEAMLPKLVDPSELTSMASIRSRSPSACLRLSCSSSRAVRTASACAGEASGAKPSRRISIAHCDCHAASFSSA